MPMLVDPAIAASILGNTPMPTADPRLMPPSGVRPRLMPPSGVRPRPTQPAPAPSPAPQIPLPTPDPRGPSFEYRLPPQILQSQTTMGNFGPDQIPANEFLRQRGYYSGRDSHSIPPDASKALQQAFYPEHFMPDSYGAGKYKIYTPGAEDHTKDAAIERLITLLAKKR